MATTTSYLPATDSGLLQWSANFSTQINAVGAAAAFGITEKQGTDYAALQADYAAKYTAATQPETRGGANVLAKNDAKKPLVAESRKLAMQITNFEGVTNQQRFDLGLTVRDNEPSPVPVPSTMPRITFLPSTGRTINFKVNDVDETKRGRPPEAAAALIYTFVGDSAPLDITQWQFQGPSSTVVNDVTFPIETPAGSTTWVTALWVNRKMQPGPASQPVSINIAGGGVSMAA